MGSWGVMGHESDCGLDAMIVFMKYGKKCDGQVALQDAMNRLRERGIMIPQDAKPEVMMRDDPGLLWSHEFTVMALAEAVVRQNRNGSYSVYDYNMLPTLSPDGEPDQSEVEERSDERVSITCTKDDITFIRDEIDRFLHGSEDETEIRFGWVDPPKWHRHVTSIMEQLKAIESDLSKEVPQSEKSDARPQKPSVLARLQEGKKAAAQEESVPKTAPKRDSEREV